MSYALIIAEARLGVFEERNLDTIGLASVLQKESCLLLPDKAYAGSENLTDTIIKVQADEETFLNPLNLTTIVAKVMESRGKPDFILLTHSSSGMEAAGYLAGFFSLPLLTDVARYDAAAGVFYKSYYSDKVFAEFRLAGAGPFVLTLRSGSFKDQALAKGAPAAVEELGAVGVSDKRTFVAYVEEEKGEIDITKADFLVSVGRGVGNKDEIPDYMELADMLKGVLSGSRPVIDKLWLPKPRQVGTSGKTVKPKVYLAMGISGAFQHIAGMKDSDCIIAVNKDAEAPIFQYAHFGIIADMHKVRDKLKALVKG